MTASHRQLVAAAAVAAVLLLFIRSAPASAAQQQSGCLGLEQKGVNLRADDIQGLLATNKAVVCHGVTITGALDISDTGEVKRSFVIEDSTLDSIAAENVEFDSRFSLASSKFRMSDQYRAQLHPGPDRCDDTDAPGSFAANGTADFSGARFDDVVSFALTCFEGQLILKDSEFRNLAGFEFAEFHANTTVSIDDTLFSEANFTGARFKCRVQLRRVTGQAIRFVDSELLYQNDESSKQYCGDNGTEVWNLRFLGSRVSGLLDLTDIRFLTAANIDSNLWGTLRMNPGDADKIIDPSIRDDALRQIERTSRASGDIGTANDALWAIRKAEQASLPPIFMQLSVFFWEWGGGFFIRPWRPLLAFGALFVLGSASAGLRVLVRKRMAKREPAADVAPDKIENPVEATLKAMLSPKLSPPTEDGPFRSWQTLEYLVEYFGGKYLAVAFFLALGTSSPTLEPIIRALIPAP